MQLIRFGGMDHSLPPPPPQRRPALTENTTVAAGFAFLKGSTEVMEQKKKTKHVSAQPPGAGRSRKIFRFNTMNQTYRAELDGSRWTGMEFLVPVTGLERLKLS